MATNFPNSVDNLTNPTTSDTLATVSHSGQHTDANDAIEAIETALLDGAPLHIDDTNERVGIGTTSPSYKLDVNGDAQVTGRLGIGSGISAELDIKGASNPEIRLQSTDSSDPFLYFGDQVDAVRGGIGYDTSANALLLRGYNNNTRMTITSTGNVGIGTTSPTNQFEVYNGTYYSIVGRNDWGLRSTGTYALTTSAGANVYISSNGTFYRSTSSGKYKTDVEDMNTDAADVVFALRPVWFRSTSPLDPEGWSYYGLIAEEVAEVDPRLVSFGAREDCGCDADADHVADCLTEPEGVYYDRLVPHLINVVQRQQAQINELVARIEALEAG